MDKDKDLISEIAKKSFSAKFVQGLLNWNKRQNKRQMPWKGEKDPYKIWLSEIILQQTRVDQGLSYYNRFIKTYPRVKDLAQAPEQEVFKLWEGLGYYSRCQNLITSAKYISNVLNGVFPINYEEVLSLKGVGSYTASAIVSFAYNQPYAVLDGNVFRVLSRIFDIETPIDSLEGKKLFSFLAQNILPKTKSAEYNQAIMDFGATVCKPSPECSICFFKNQCSAFLKDKQHLLPIKSKRISVKERWFNYIIPQHKNTFAIQKRVEKDIWENLFEFFLIETPKKTGVKKMLLRFEQSYGLTENDYSLIHKPLAITQRLTHQIIHFQFIKVEIHQRSSSPENNIWVKGAHLPNYPFPKTLQQYILTQFQ